MINTIKHPFTTLTDGKYFYKRKSFSRATPVDVEVRGGKFSIRFPNNTSAVKVSNLPNDAEFTPRD